MPNFVCRELRELNFPMVHGKCSFLWFMHELKGEKRTENKLIFTRYDNTHFFLEARKKAGTFVVKGDKITKPANISYLHTALGLFRDNYTRGVTSSATNVKKVNDMPFVLEPAKLADILNTDEYEQNLQFPQLYGIWNLDFYDEIRMEIGFGTAKHLLYRASKEPNVLFVGVEIYRPGVLKASKQASEMGLKNILLTCADIRQLTELFGDGIFGLIYMHFPVPWNDSPTRRAINMNFVTELSRILKQGGVFQLRSDDREFFDDSVKLFLNLPHAELRAIKNTQLDVISKYEERWREQNKDIYDLNYICEKNSSLNHRRMDCDFTFGHVSDDIVEKIRAKFANETMKFDGYFIHPQALYESEDEARIMLKASMGDFYAPCSVFILITPKGAKYIQQPPKTFANASAHEKLKEYIACQA